VAQSYRQRIKGGIQLTYYTTTGLTNNQQTANPHAVKEHQEFSTNVSKVERWSGFAVGQEGIFNDVNTKGEVRRSVEGKIVSLRHGGYMLWAEVELKNPPKPRHTNFKGNIVLQTFPTTTVRLK
jgi:hypothetical protein